MDPREKLKLEQGRVLRQAREAAGFKSLASAIRASPRHEKWKPSTLSAHERGFRSIDQWDAERYARFYRAYGAKITGQEILYPGSESSLPAIVEAKLAVLTAEVKKLAEAAREQRRARPPPGSRPRSTPKVPPRGSKS
jgi:hypothetical protein